LLPREREKKGTEVEVLVHSQEGEKKKLPGAISLFATGGGSGQSEKITKQQRRKGERNRKRGRLTNSNLLKGRGKDTGGNA